MISAAAAMSICSNVVKGEGNASLPRPPLPSPLSLSLPPLPPATANLLYALRAVRFFALRAAVTILAGLS